MNFHFFPIHSFFRFPLILVSQPPTGCSRVVPRTYVLSLVHAALLKKSAASLGIYNRPLPVPVAVPKACWRLLDIRAKLKSVVPAGHNNLDMSRPPDN